MSEFKLSNRSLKNREGVHPKLIQICDRAIEITNVDFGIPETGGLRSDEQQKYLFQKGLSKADGVLKRSRHQEGRALDFFPYVAGKASYLPGDCAMVAAAFLQAASELGYKLQWGGHWFSFKDYPHVQLHRDEE